MLPLVSHHDARAIRTVAFASEPPAVRETLAYLGEPTRGPAVGRGPVPGRAAVAAGSGLSWGNSCLGQSSGQRRSLDWPHPVTGPPTLRRARGRHPCWARLRSSGFAFRTHGYS